MLLCSTISHPLQIDMNDQIGNKRFMAITGHGNNKDICKLHLEGTSVKIF